MSRSGYDCDLWDCDAEEMLRYGRYRGQVASALRGQRGQKFLRDLLQALEAMPVRELDYDLEGKSLRPLGDCACALGVLAEARGLNATEISPGLHKELSKVFDIAPQMVKEIMFINDYEEIGFTPDEKTRCRKNRWCEVHEWVIDNLQAPKSDAKKPAAAKAKGKHE